MKDTHITVRLTKDIKDKLEEKAQSKGMVISEYIRYLIIRDLETK